jgi:hypothetical protein
MLDFVPLHLGVLERSPPVLQWIQSWVPPSHTVIPLQPIDWFQLGHGINTWLPNLDGLPTPICGLSGNEVLVWAPPPAAANVAVEQLSYSRTKRPFLSHVFVVPRLMTSLWRKQLFKLADCVFTLPVAFNSAVWPLDMCEPLIVGVVLPFLPVAPWSRRNTPAILAVGSSLSSMFSTLSGDECHLLRQLWSDTGGGV